MNNTSSSVKEATKNLVRKRKSLPSKLIRIRCTNLDIHKIVTPLIDVATIALKTTTASNLPNIHSLSTALLPTKKIIAKILEAYENENVVPETIIKINLSLDISEDIYKIYFEHVRGIAGTLTIQPYNLHLKPAMDHSLYKGMMVRHKEIHPDAIKEILECL